MNPIGAILTAVFAAVVLMGSRKTAVLGLIAGVCYLTQGQEIVVAGFNLTAIRILLLAGFSRVLVRGEAHAFRMNAIDKILFTYAGTLAVVSLLREGWGALAYELGFLYNILLSYSTVRALVRSLDELSSILVSLAYLIIPLAVFMTIEHATYHNYFSAFGGVSSEVWMRDGSVRSMGAFRNPITAGSFGATLAPLFAGLIFTRTAVRQGVIGLIASTIIVITAHSSGPLMAYVSGCMALALWPLRQQMRTIRWAVVSVLCGLQLVMKAPVWFLIGRVSDVVGGGGYFRAHLIDRFIHEFGSWWLIGTSDTGAWMPTRLSFGSADITNQFIADGLNGGILGFVLGILIFTRCFQGLGLSLRQAQSVSLTRERMLWCVGATLYSHLVNQLSVTYFDQMHVMWFFLLAVIASVTSEILSESEDSLARDVLFSTAGVPEH